MPHEISVDSLREQFDAFLNTTLDQRNESERDRDFKDGKQWTQEEADTLRSRGQAPIVINRIGSKIDFIVGLEEQNRGDPKAFPRTPEHEEASHGVTDALRFVADDNEFDSLAADVLEWLTVEGYAASIIETEERRGETSIVIRPIPWDRFYYDPHSRRKDFKDSNFMGIVIWMDKDDAMRQFPDAEELIDASFSSAVAGDTFDDRPDWVDTKRNRIKVCQHIFKHNGQWHFAFFSGENILLGPDLVPFVDEEGEPINPIEAVSAYIDRENQRYGYIRRYIDPQKEYNKRRSKALHLLSVRQTQSQKGAVDDVYAVKEELAKPNGHIETNPGYELSILDTGDMAQAQFSLLTESKNELDSVGASGERDASSNSGRDRQLQQEAGVTELQRLFAQHRDWKRRVYEQCWLRIRQFWTRQKWVRVTDNEDNLKFVGLNQQITVGEALQQRIQDEDIDDETRQQAQLMLQQMVQRQDPRLNQVIEVRNKVPELEMDIKIRESRESINIQQEQFEKLIELAKAYGPQNVPFELALEMSQLRNKDEVLDKLSGRDGPSRIQQQMMQLEMEGKQAENRKTQFEAIHELAEAQKAENEASQTNLENQTIRRFPDTKPNVNV